MAINRGVLGSQTGSMGGITASNWKGRNVYKQKVPATNTSNSPAQAAQRRKFAVLAKLAGMLGQLIRTGFNSAAATITEQNAFVKANFEGVSDNGTVATFDYAKLKVSAGAIAGVDIKKVSFNPITGTYDIEWTDNSNGASALPSDVSRVVLLNTKTGDAYVSETPFPRDNESAAQIAATLIGSPVADIRGYLFFKRATSTATSPSSTAVATAY